MYASHVQDQDLTFGVSGMLWNRSLVMYDEQTESYWSHILGEAMAGTLEGEKLKPIPSVMTDWRSWFASNPQTTVLWMDRTAERFRSDALHDLNQLVLGIELAGKPFAWSYAYLLEHQPLTEEVAGFPLFIVMHPDSKAVMVYDRRVAGQRFDLQMEQGQIVNEQTGAAWDLITGRAMDGGDPLTPIPSIPSFQKAWLTFHPECTVVE